MADKHSELEGREYPETMSECYDAIECQDLYIEGLEARIAKLQEQNKKLVEALEDIAVPDGGEDG